MKIYKGGSILGFINYTMFWTGLTLVKYVYTETGKTKSWALKRIKTVFGHNDKSLIWTEE